MTIRPSHRGSWNLLAALILGAAVSACGNPTEPSPVFDPSATPMLEGPTRGDALVVALPFDPASLNPVVLPYAMSQMISEQVQPGLARRKVGNGTITFEPALAREWSFDDAGTALTYTLHDGLVWEDGTPLTSADVAFTYELIADRRVASNWVGDARYIRSVEAPNDTTVVFHFTERQNPAMLQGYTVRGIVPKHVLASVDRKTLRGSTASTAPLASGSFRVASWEPNNKLVLEPNPKAPPGLAPNLDRVIFKILPEYSTRLLELELGTVDMVPSIDAEDLSTLRTRKSIHLERLQAASMHYIGYDLRDARFADKSVREALTMGIDRERMIRDYMTVDGTSYGRYCIGTVSPLYLSWFPSDVVPLAYDPRGAIRVLEEAGWKDSDGDGVRDNKGLPLEFVLMVQTGNSSLKRLAVLVQAYWESIGVKVDIEWVEPTRFSQRAREKDFDAILWGFGANPKIDPGSVWRSDAAYNWFGYNNPEVDKLVDTALTAQDVADAQKAVKDVQRKVHADHPVTFLYWQDEVVGLDRRFKQPDGGRPRMPKLSTLSVLEGLHTWYVPEPEQKYRGVLPSTETLPETTLPPSQHMTGAGAPGASILWAGAGRALVSMLRGGLSAGFTRWIPGRWVLSAPNGPIAAGQYPRGSGEQTPQ